MKLMVPPKERVFYGTVWIFTYSQSVLAPLLERYMVQINWPSVFNNYLLKAIGTGFIA